MVDSSGNLFSQLIFFSLDTIKTKEKKRKKKGETDPDKIQYSEEISKFDYQLSFQDMNLSRPLLKVRTHVTN